MNPFISFRDKDKTGELQYYLLQREYPHFVGRLDYAPLTGQIYQVPVAGHHLYITFAGTLRGNLIPSYTNIEQEIGSVFESMAVWFYHNRIKPEPKRYKKWAIPV